MPDLFKNWGSFLNPLYEKYGSRRHPLWCENRYQLFVKVVLSARDSDAHINALAPSIFAAFPSMKELSAAPESAIFGKIREVSNCANKAKWLKALAEEVRSDDNIPRTLDGLTALPGIGRKSANVIIRETGGEAEGIIVDLHVVRVAPRLGIVSGKTPEKIERELMEHIPQKDWNRAGMALSFLGREICRPTNPKCPQCPLKDCCEWDGKRL